MKIMIALFTLLTLGLSASLAVARDANREAIWRIEQQQQKMYQQWAAQTAQPGGYWTGYQRSYAGTYPYSTPNALRFFGN